jgi:hypothetical protein
MSDSVFKGGVGGEDASTVFDLAGQPFKSGDIDLIGVDGSIYELEKVDSFFVGVKFLGTAESVGRYRINGMVKKKGS